MLFGLPESKLVSILLTCLKFPACCMPQISSVFCQTQSLGHVNVSASWTSLGGGHGWLQGHHGLITDQLQSMNVVLASRELKTIDSNSCLWWDMQDAGHNTTLVSSRPTLPRFTTLSTPTGRLSLLSSAVTRLRRFTRLLTSTFSRVDSRPQTSSTGLTG
jgi:hypothetical protein